jgi:predicted DNA-binding transcriptional regulator AlpA
MRPDNEQLETLLTVKDVAEILSVGVRTVWRWAATDKIPRPIRLTSKIRRWKASQLQAYLDRIPAEPKRALETRGVSSLPVK